MSTTSSRNFTTLYSGSGSVVPQGAYGNANVVSLLNVGTDGANTVANIVATGNITAPSIGFNGLSEIQFSPVAGGPIYISPATNAVYYPQVTINDGFSPDPTVLIRNTLEVVDELTVPNITSTTIVNAGNVTTGGFFIGNFIGNISGNVTAAGANTQVQFNDGGTLGAAAGLTFNKTSNALVVIGNITGGNVAGTTVSATTVSATANITGGNVNTGGVVSAAANITGGNVLTPGQVTATGNVSGGNVLTPGQVTATGNVTGNYILGNGSQLTGLPATYGNANVSNFLANGFGSNTISTTGNITSGNLITSTVNGVGTANLTLTAGPNSSGAATGVVLDAGQIIAGRAGVGAGITGANQVDLGIRPGYGQSDQPQITLRNYTGPTNGNLDLISALTGTVGTINLYGNTNIGATTSVPGSKGNLIVANAVYVGESISATGNVTGNYFIGNGSQLTGLPATYGNANVSAYLASGTNTANIITTGNIASGNISTTGELSVAGNTTLAGPNVTVSASAIYFLQPGAAGFAGGIGAAAFGPSASYTVATYNTANAFVSTRMQLDDGTSNISFDGVTLGNVNIQSQGSNWIFANATGNLTLPSNTSAINYANGTSILNGLAGTYGNANVADFLANGFGSNVILTTGNINGGNLVAAANLTSTQQTVVGTGNITGGTGNIILSGKNIATDMAFNPDGGNATNAALSRIVVGTGWLGNITHDARQNRLMVQDTFARSNTGTAVQLMVSDPIVSLTGNVTNPSFRVQAVGGRVRVGGGSMGNTIQLSATGAGTIGAVIALQPNIDVGNVSPYFLGNTTISHATLNGGFITTQSGGFIGNAYGMIPGALATASGNADATGNITNYIGIASNLQAAPYITGNLYAFYHPNVANSSEQSATALGVAAAARRATNYYAFRNDDPFAQVQLGSLRTFHEYQHSTSTSGTVNINKNNGQVQYIAPTANVTIGDFQNFVFNAVSSASNVSLANIAQVDTVTLVIQQGATPYTVTMPTGNAQIKYASGNSTVGSTANAATMISITGTKVGNATTAGTGLYLVTVSPEFT